MRDLPKNDNYKVGVNQAVFTGVDVSGREEQWEQDMLESR